jgi:hypothetical protein
MGSSSVLLNSDLRGGRFQACFKHEGTRGVGQLRVNDVFRERSLRFDLETHPQHAATTAATEARVM